MIALDHPFPGYLYDVIRPVPGMLAKHDKTVDIRLNGMERLTIAPEESISGFLHKIFLTTPLSASTSMRSPSLNTFVAIFVPITHGFFISRATMAAWEVMPPISVTNAAARIIAGKKSGVDVVVTRISPLSTWALSFGESTIFTLPLIIPGYATSPKTSCSPLVGVDGGGDKAAFITHPLSVSSKVNDFRCSIIFLCGKFLLNNSTISSGVR